MGKSIKNKSNYMRDGDSDKNMEEDIFGESLCKVSHDGDVFQPFWVRCDTVLSLYFDREFVVRKSNFVLIKKRVNINLTFLKLKTLINSVKIGWKLI